MSGLPGEACPDKRWVGRSFGAAARSYDSLAHLQRDVGDLLLHRMPPLEEAPASVLDVGSGTGYLSEKLAAAWPEARVIALDIAEGMLQVARERWSGPGTCRWVCGDAEALPLADRSVGLVVSNLALQWCSDLGAVFREFARVLQPGGAVLFSTFAPGTLCELRAAWRAVDAYSHVNDFADPTSVEAALAGAGFSATWETEERRLVYPDVQALMRELKGLGARNITGGRPRHLTGRRAMEKMIAAYTADMTPGAVWASFEFIYGCAFLEMHHL